MQFRSRPESSRTITVLFTLTAFLSACLMFVIEPMAGKALLSDFGGVASVWGVVMVFFQLATLAGYALAHVAVARLGIPRAAAMLIVIGIVGVLLAPPTPRVLDIGLGPFAAMMLTLGASYGPAMVALATTMPLLQHWYVRHVGQEPFSLYAVTNAGSLLGLALYPCVLEPLIGGVLQGAAWRLTYLVWIAGVAACAAVALNGPPSPMAMLLGVTLRDEAVSRRRRAAWVLLAAIPSSLLLGVTQHLTVDIAPVPVLWTLPLALYLVTLVAASARPAQTLGRGRVYQALAIPPLVVLALLPIVETAMPLRSAAIHLVGFAGCAMLCHGRLAELRPGARRSTEFYLLVSLGAALGGLFNVAVAPLVFDRLTEYPLALVACCLVAPTLPRRRLPREIALLPALTLLGLELARRHAGDDVVFAPLLSGGTLILMAFGVSAIALATTRFGLAALCAVGLVLPLYAPALPGGSEVYASRDFYGPLLVREEGGVRELVRGSELHAREIASEREVETTIPMDRRRVRAGLGPLTGFLKDRLAEGRQPLEALVVGVGAGRFACHADSQMRVSFAEIDPDMVAMAQRAFRHISRCGMPPVDIGDGRRAVERREVGSLDLLVLNAFSSANVPAHLLTVEAFQLYLARLRPEGLIAIRTSVRFLDLAPVVAAAAAWSGATALAHHAASPAAELSSDWVVIATDAGMIGALQGQGWHLFASPPGSVAWHDDKWDLNAVLNLRRQAPPVPVAEIAYFPG